MSCADSSRHRPGLTTLDIDPCRLLLKPTQDDTRHGFVLALLKSIQDGITRHWPGSTTLDNDLGRLQSTPARADFARHWLVLTPLKTDSGRHCSTLARADSARNPLRTTLLDIGLDQFWKSTQANADRSPMPTPVDIVLCRLLSISTRADSDLHRPRLIPFDIDPGWVCSTSIRDKSARHRLRLSPLDIDPGRLRSTSNWTYSDWHQHRSILFDIGRSGLTPIDIADPDQHWPEPTLLDIVPNWRGSTWTQAYATRHQPRLTRLDIGPV